MVYGASLCVIGGIEYKAVQRLGQVLAALWCIAVWYALCQGGPQDAIAIVAPTGPQEGNRP